MLLPLERIRTIQWNYFMTIKNLNTSNLSEITKPQNEAHREGKKERKAENLLAPLDVLNGDELLDALVPNQPGHPEVAGPQLLHRLVPLLH